MTNGKIIPFTSSYNIMGVLVLTNSSIGLGDDEGPKISARTFHEIRKIQNYDFPLLVKIGTRLIEPMPYGTLKEGEISVPGETYMDIAKLWEPGPLERIALIPRSEQEVKRYFAEFPYKRYYS